MSIYLWLLTRAESAQHANGDTANAGHGLDEEFVGQSVGLVYTIKSISPAVTLVANKQKRSPAHRHTHTRPDGYTELSRLAHMHPHPCLATHTHSRAREKKFTANTKPFISFYCISSPLMGPRALLNYSRARAFLPFFSWLV